MLEELERIADTLEKIERQLEEINHAWTSPGMASLIFRSDISATSETRSAFEKFILNRLKIHRILSSSSYLASLIKLKAAAMNRRPTASAPNPPRILHDI